MAEQVYNEEDLNKMCKDYQKILNIQDWKIIVSLVDQNTIKNANAECRMVESIKRAHIKIPSPETWKPDPILPQQDMRLSLLHELVHIVFAYSDPCYKPDSLKHNLWEASIEAVSEGLNSLLTIADAFTALHQKAQETATNEEESEQEGQPQGFVPTQPDQKSE